MTLFPLPFYPQGLQYLFSVAVIQNLAWNLEGHMDTKVGEGEQSHQSGNRWLNTYCWSHYPLLEEQNTVWGWEHWEEQWINTKSINLRKLSAQELREKKSKSWLKINCFETGEQGSTYTICKYVNVLTCFYDTHCMPKKRSIEVESHFWVSACIPDVKVSFEPWNNWLFGGHTALLLINAQGVKNFWKGGIYLKIKMCSILVKNGEFKKLKIALAWLIWCSRWILGLGLLYSSMVTHFFYRKIVLLWWI